LSFFVDTNVLVYAVEEGPYGPDCMAILAAVAAGRADGLCSVSVLEELWHLESRGRVPALAGQTRNARAVFGSLLPIDEATFDLAMSLQAPAQLGTNDRIHAACCMQNSIPYIVTADAAFSEIRGLERVDPGDAAAVSALIA